MILSESLLALSWKDPFATLMLHNKIETRTWATKYRGLVLICASKAKYKISQVMSIAGIEQLQRINGIMMEYSTDYSVDGMAIAIGRLVDCRPMQRADEDKCFVQYNPILHCHIYEEVRAIESFP